MDLLTVKNQEYRTIYFQCPSGIAQGTECKSGESSQTANTQAKMSPEEKQEERSNIKASGLSGTSNPFPSIPSSSVKFYHSWCNLKTAEEKYQYLKVIFVTCKIRFLILFFVSIRQTLENAPLHKLLGVNLGSDMLSDILQVLKQFCLQDKTSPMKILSEIAMNKESGILIMMLGEKDKHGEFIHSYI